MVRSYLYSRRARALLLALVGLVFAIIVGERHPAAVPLSGGVTQNFDAIGTTASAALPLDFRADNPTTVRTVGSYAAAGTATVRLGGANLSTSASNGIYNFGAGTTTTGPDRAIGFLSSGSATASGNLYVKLTNNTGASLSSLTISYNVEKYRNGTNAAGFRIQLFYSTDGTSWTTAGSNFTTAFAADSGTNSGYAIAPGVTVPVSGKKLVVTIPDGTDFYLAWNYSVTSGSTTTNAQALAIDDISVSGSTGRPLQATGSANPARLSPGDTTLLTTSVTAATEPDSTGISVTGDLTAIGGDASQTFYDDGTHGDATAGDNVFSCLATVGTAVIPGAKSLPMTIGDEQHRAANTAIGLTVDPPISAIHDIQGATGTSPFAGQLVAVTGIVTGVKPSGSRGFFVQAPDDQADGDTKTSEGVFVYTGSTPPSAAAVGNLVKVVGTVQEYAGVAPAPTLTEIGSPSLAVTLLSTGNPLPAAITLTAADTLNPGAGPNVLERFEGMRVHVDTVTVVGPTIGWVDEASATADSKGTFFAVVADVPRPFREPGVDVSDNLLPGSVPDYNPPRFDGNPERLQIASSALGGNPIDVASGATVTNLTGPLDYGSRTYTIDLDATTTPVVTDTVSATAVPAAMPGQFTVASFNMEHFYDSVDDAGGDVMLTPAAFEQRLAKASLVIRNVMRMPDIIGVQEVENLATLQTIAQRVNDDAVAGGAQDPGYQAYLELGNDSSDINVGFLVKRTATVVSVTQVGKDTKFADPRDGSLDTLNDRPPLVLIANVHDGRGGPDFPVTVIANHLRSLIDVSTPGDGGPKDAGLYARTKRQLGAEFLASLIQSHQALGEHVISLGDYNAYQFNDGYVDVVGTVLGAPAPATQVAKPSDDLVDPNLTDLVDFAPAAERYSYVENGSAQVLDHVIVTSDLLTRVVRLAYGRCDADFPDVYRNDATRPERLSDHDPAVAYFTFPTADLAVAVSAVRNPVLSGSTVNYTVSVTNTAADDAANVTVTDTLPAHTTFVKATAPAGWTCTTDEQTVTCTAASVAAGSNSTIAIDAALDCDLANGLKLTNQVGITADTYDPNEANNSASFDSTVVNNPPVVTLRPATPATLWPVNHKMVPVTLDYDATDDCGIPVCSVSVTSNEPVNGRGDGNTATDWTILDAKHVELRAERSGTGLGRIYTIAVTCTDGAGNPTTQTTQVVVPKSNK